MKSFFYILAALLFLIVGGCSDNDPIITPESISTEDQNIKWIMLPEVKEKLASETLLWDIERVNGNYGGGLELEGSFWTYNNQLITIESELTIPGGNAAYNGNRIMAMYVWNYAGLDLNFSPSQQFNTPLQLDFSISGLDLTGINPDDVEFYYVATNGTAVPTVNDGVQVNISTGTLTVFKARIPHFSRYAFVH